MDEYIGAIQIFAGNFAPRGWALCEGQILPIQQNTALFSILGTTYGGNGTTTFGLPDLRGRMPIGFGAGPGLTPRQLGEKSGAEAVTLTTAQIPSHTHTYNALSGNRESTSPANNFLGVAPGAWYGQKDAGDTLLPMGAEAVSPAGGSQPHNNMPPYLGLSFIICLQGIYPPRS